MKLIKALVALNMARSNAEANRLVKQNAVWVGNCKEGCSLRHTSFTCNCGGWHKAFTPTEDIPVGGCLRIKEGNIRLMTRENGNQGFDQLQGSGRITVDLELVEN